MRAEGYQSFENLSYTNAFVFLLECGPSASEEKNRCKPGPEGHPGASAVCTKPGKQDTIPCPGPCIDAEDDRHQ